MKRIIISAFSAFLVFSTIAAADEKSDKVEQVKQQILQQIDKKTAEVNQVRSREDAILSQFKTCIQAMKNEADFNACVAAKDESAKKFRMELEKAYLDSQKKAIANEEKRLNDEMKSAPKK